MIYLALTHSCVRGATCTKYACVALQFASTCAFEKSCKAEVGSYSISNISDAGNVIERSKHPFASENSNSSAYFAEQYVIHLSKRPITYTDSLNVVT